MKKFCLFIGYPRSGSTISGRLLDLHPQIAIAHQINVFQSKNKDEMIDILMKRFYNTETLQGIEVIGTKSGHQTVKHMLRNPDFKLEDFKTMIDMPLKMLHIVRNPYDNLATWVVRATEENERKGNKVNQKKLLNAKIDHYSELNDKIMELIEKEDVFTYKLDRMIKKPGKTMKNIYDYLGVGYNGNIITQAKSMIYDKPKITREDIPWSTNQIKRVADLIEKYPFLKGYSFEYNKEKYQQETQQMKQLQQNTLVQ